MRTPVKFRLAFFILAIASYAAGFQLLPDTLSAPYSSITSLIFAVTYFVILPILYWFWVIKIGKQKAWKMILIFSLSAAVTRYSFPQEIAAYFEFIAWLRYPIIGVLLLIEFYLIFHVVKLLWGARKLKGDPRVNVPLTLGDEDEKKRTLAFTFAYEPASWFYAFPFFTRHHVYALANIQLHSASRWHYLLIITALGLATLLTYWALLGVSELVAIIVASLVAYGVILLTANHRVSRYYSLYSDGKNLVLNNNIFGMLVLPHEVIEKAEVGEWYQDEDKEALFMGNGKHANVKLLLNKPQPYFSMMGQVNEDVEYLYVCVDQPNIIAEFVASEKP